MFQIALVVYIAVYCFIVWIYYSLFIHFNFINIWLSLVLFLLVWKTYYKLSFFNGNRIMIYKLVLSQWRNYDRGH